MLEHGKAIPLPQLAERLAAYLSVRPSGLITDIDGTISHIALRPDAAVVEPEAIAALRQLADRLDLVAAITGRGASDAARMLQLPGVVVIGNHGMERLDLGGITVAEAARPYLERLGAVMAELEGAAAIPGVVVERKGATGSVHYRGAPEPELAEAALRQQLEPLVARHGLKLTQGRMVFELRPPVAIDKGTALAELVSAFTLRNVLMFGDDYTDIDAMFALAQLRAEGMVDGFSVAVVAAETPPPLFEAADFVVDGVDAMVALLAHLVVALGRAEQADTSSTAPDAEGPVKPVRAIPPL